MFEIIRKSLLDDARNSPGLLSDVAGLEGYLAESYNARSFTELLQNADDAGSTKFYIGQSANYLIVANDGRPFTGQDLEALCRSAASNKERGSSIGYRGIGFKSVVSLADEVHLVSGEYQLSFSRDKTRAEIPEAEKVPLIRVPHPIDKTVLAETQGDVSNLLSGGYSTVFIFSGLLNNSIRQEFEQFDTSSLLFLRSIEHLELYGTKTHQVSVSRTVQDYNAITCSLKDAVIESHWRIMSNDGVSLAFSQNATMHGVQVLDQSSALVHAFLPTHEATGLGFKINGDFSTDPSRTRVVFDDRTRDWITAAAVLISRLLRKALDDERMAEREGILKSLIPHEDPRLYEYQKRAFKGELVAAVKEHAQTITQGLFLRPTWLNAVDFHAIGGETMERTTPPVIDEIEGARRFLKYMGATELPVYSVLDAARTAAITKQGCAEITSELIKQIDTKQVALTAIDQDLEILFTTGGRKSIRKAESENATIDKNYLDMVAERSNGANGLNRLIRGVAGPQAAAALLPVERGDTPADKDRAISKGLFDSISNFVPENNSKTTTLNLKKWRGAEQQLVQLLDAEGFMVDDVSRQNIGYDIVCRNNDGQTLFIEVKLVEAESQPFIMTSNEEAVAREKGANYVIAIMRQKGDTIEVAFIPNPVENLELTRQCRQWVWECSSYPYDPTVYNLQ